MSYETYNRIARYGLFILIVVLQIPAVQLALNAATIQSTVAIGGWFGMPLGT